MTDMSAPKAPIAPPIPTKRAVPLSSVPVIRAASYCVCANNADADIVNTAKIFILFIVLKIYRKQLIIIICDDCCHHLNV